MATLEDLTSYETVLAVLGADPSELSEEAFIARELWDEVDGAISSWLPAEDSVDSIISAAADPEDETEAAVKLVKLRAYARYYCAWLLLQSGDLLFAERISDGQNEVQRSRRTDYLGLMDRMAGRMEAFKTALLQIYDPSATYSAVTLFSSAHPSYDPVQNETT